MAENENNFNSAVDKWNQILKSKYYSSGEFNPTDFINTWGRSYSNNPFIQNSRLKQLKSIAQRYTREQLESMLADPSNNELSLRKASHYFYNTIAPLMKLTNMYSDILTYRTYANVSKINDEKKILEEWASVDKWIRTINPQKTFREATLQLLIEGKRFYYIREDVDGVFALQPLPSDYCQIVHKTEDTWQIAFNMMYFMKAGVSVDWFAPEFKDYVAEFYGFYDRDKKKITDISNLPKDVQAYTENRNWYFWKTLDINKGVCFGFDNSEPEVVPVMSQMFLDASELTTYKLLEQELLSIPLRQIMTASVPFQKENKSGTYSNDTAIDPDLINLYQSIIQSILPQSVDFVAAPLEDFKIHTFDSVATRDSIVGNAISNFYSQSGISGLVSTTDKPNIAMVKTTRIVEAAFIDKVYAQFKCLMNALLKTKGYKNEFFIVIEGDRFSDEEGIKQADKDLASGHMGILPKWLSYRNIDRSTYDATTKAVSLSGIYDYLRPTTSAFQQSASDSTSKNGRPSKNPEDMADGASAESGANLEREVDG